MAKNKAVIPLAILAVVLLVFGIYTAVVFSTSDTLENVKSEFSQESVNGTSDFSQSSAISYPRWSYLTWVPSGNSDTPEMFLVHNQKYLLVTGFARFVTDEHFTGEKGEAVAFNKTILKDNRNSEFGAYFVYSQNNLSVSEIKCEFKSPSTGAVQTETLSPSADMPFALGVELSEKDMELSKIICFDKDGNMVFENNDIAA